MSRSAARSSHETEAFVLRRVEYGESDLIVTLFTRSLGRVSALARSARKSRRRFGGALEPFFTLKVRFEERSSADLFSLVESRVEKARTALLSDLARMQAGGRALGWIREAAPPRTPEPRAWALIERLLDRLAEQRDRTPELELGEAGLALLGAFGWGLDLERCVRCGKQCPLTQAGSVDPKRGGLVCRACGGGRLHVRAEQRVRLLRASNGEIGMLLPDDAALAVDLVERVLVTHAGIES